MLERQTSIFYKLTKEDEDSTTDLLSNLFRIKVFRDLCFDYFGIKREIYEEIGINNIKTRQNIKNVGIPDIYLQNEETLYFFENKIYTWTDLQDSQISTYPEYINNINLKNKGYFFIIPEDYEHKNKIIEISKKYNFIKIFYWEEFLQYIQKTEIENCSELIKESVYYLRTLISDGISENLTLDIYEVTAMYNPKDIYTILNLVFKNIETLENVTEKVIKKLGKNFSVGRTQQDQYGFGTHIKYYNKECIFCGINPYNYEQENGNFVYSIALYKKYIVEDFSIDSNRFPYISDEDCVYIQLDRKLFLDESKGNDLQEEIINIIKNVFIKNWNG